MSEVKMIMVGDTNVGRPNPDSAFESVQHLPRILILHFVI